MNGQSQFIRWFDTLIDQGFDHFMVALSVSVQKMVRLDLTSSGVMFSLDTESGFRDVVFINDAYGLGENVVQGAVDPDEFYVHKPTFEQGHRAVQVAGVDSTVPVDPRCRLQRHLLSRRIFKAFRAETFTVWNQGWLAA